MTSCSLLLVITSCPLLLVITSCPLLLVISPLTRSPCCKRGRRIRLWLVIEAMCQRQPKDNWISHDFIIIFFTHAMCFLTDWVVMKCALCSVSTPHVKRTSRFSPRPPCSMFLPAWDWKAPCSIGMWVCLKIGYIPNYSHLIGIIIINHWV